MGLNLFILLLGTQRLPRLVGLSKAIEMMLVIAMEFHAAMSLKFFLVPN